MTLFSNLLRPPLLLLLQSQCAVVPFSPWVIQAPLAALKIVDLLPCFQAGNLSSQTRSNSHLTILIVSLLFSLKQAVNSSLLLNLHVCFSSVASLHVFFLSSRQTQ